MTTFRSVMLTVRSPLTSPYKLDCADNDKGHNNSSDKASRCSIREDKIVFIVFIGFLVVILPTNIAHFSEKHHVYSIFISSIRVIRISPAGF